MALYYDPDLDPETRAAIREEFVRALASFPVWAVHKAFDAWTKSSTRRPTPGEIVILVNREMKPMVDELAARTRDEIARKEYREALTPAEIEKRRIFAQGVMRRMGYAKDEAPKGPRRETVTDEDLAEMADLIKKGATK